MFKEIKQFVRSCIVPGGDNIQAELKLVPLPPVHGPFRRSPSVLSKVQGAVWFHGYKLCSIKDTSSATYTEVTNNRIQMPRILDLGAGYTR